MGNEQSRDADVSTNGIAVEKHENGSANGLSAHIKLNGLETSVNAHRNGELKSLKPTAESGSHVAVQAGAKPADVEVASEAGDMTDGKKSKVKEKPQLLDKLFKKKAGRAAGEDQTNQTFNEDGVQSLTAPQKETVDLRQGPATGPQNGTPHPRPEVENPSSISPPAEEEGEDNPVMNFFKTLVTPTKTPKKETAAPDAAKDQPLKETQPAATTTVAQVSEPPAAPKGMPAPPPPPPEPPKAEAKGEAAVKPVKAKDEAKAAAKEPQSSKGKSATLSKLFRSKKVDFSKAATLEAVAKPEPPPPAREEKKSSKPSFFSAFKPKAAEPKKTAASPPAAAEAALAVKAKEEPKPAAKSTEAAAENKPASTVSQAADDAAGVPKKLEKRNSIQLFFKNLGQKRHSTDAGVQTEPAAAAPAEKAK
ncbi:translation initiation factor IF-2 isoform X7 [Oryzias latipes]|uniref:translation initiation factor IF-2 isoform X7 n=1 Tax=Oryzias latipes TaxID=8090 RepID=UPI000CE24D13|nr:translation initiation factor IF-2 isoform X7 [Oryzias latipes]